MDKSKKTSQYIGVCFDSSRSKFMSYIKSGAKTIYLGRFDNEIDAAKCRDEYVINNGLCHRINFFDAIPENLIPNTKLIRLHNNMFAIVDDCDFEKVNNKSWHAYKHRNTYYARTDVFDGSKYAGVQMHRFILELSDPEIQVDHKNGNGLNCSRSNMRTCTNLQNSWNKAPFKNRASIYKGVCWHKHTKKFVSRIRVYGKLVQLGYFTDEIEAAKAYDVAAKKHFGEFARINFND